MTWRAARSAPEPGVKVSAGPSFLDYPAPGVPPGSARAALIPVPYDGTVSYRPGARFGPAAIIAASAQMEDYDIELGCDPSALGIHTAPAVEPGGEAVDTANAGSGDGAELEEAA